MVSGKVWNRLRHFEVKLGLSPFYWTFDYDLYPGLGRMYINIGPMSIELSW